jgi:hypothetical protein
MSKCPAVPAHGGRRSELSKNVAKPDVDRLKRPIIWASFLVISAVVGASCGSAALGSTTAATDKAGFPAAYPSFTYPVSDPGLPQDCRINNPNQHWSSEVGTSHLLRSTGGVTEARALAIPKANIPGVSGELSAFENEVGNCFYSSAVVQKHNRYEMVFGFKDALDL